MYGWLDHWAHGHAEDLIAEAQRHRLARALKDARRIERPAGRSPARGLVDVFAAKSVLEQPVCEECLAE